MLILENAAIGHRDLAILPSFHLAVPSLAVKLHQRLRVLSGKHLATRTCLLAQALLTSYATPTRMLN
jgi:hypothetical protein